VYDDGGRLAAGLKPVKTPRDCGVRAIAIAARLPYKEARTLANRHCQRFHRPNESASKGLYRDTMDSIFEELGWQWVATMGKGTGCTVHLTPSELPKGRIVVRLSKHYAAVIDGVLHDLSDSSREGKRCVYGYWQKPPTPAIAGGDGDALPESLMRHFRF